MSSSIAVSANRIINIPYSFSGMRIDLVLSQLFPEYSRAQLSQWLKAGIIIINELQWKPKDKVRGGETVFFSSLSSLSYALSPLPESIPLEVVYEDEYLLVINKPAGLIVHPGAGNPQHTLMNGLLYYYEPLKYIPRAGLIHRLDKDTSGLLVIAKTLECHTALVRLMQERQIERHYLALVQGIVTREGTIHTCYGRHPRNRLKMAVLTKGREAITHYKPIKIYSEHSLLQVKLLTGRTHQIRVHLAYIKYPILGDPLYGHKRVTTLSSLVNHFKRQALHATSLNFIHPIKNSLLSLTQPPPADFNELLRILEHEHDKPNA